MKDFLPQAGAIALMVVAAIVSRDSPSARPPAMPSSLDIIPQEQWAPARLWQDPLSAAQEASRNHSSPEEEEEEEDHGNKQREPLHVLSHEAQPLSFRIAVYGDEAVRDHEKKESTLVLLAMLKGGTYGENVESRRRTRHAVMSAAMRAGFKPVDAEHIGVARWRDSTPAVRKQPGASSDPESGDFAAGTDHDDVGSLGIVAQFAQRWWRHVNKPLEPLTARGAEYVLPYERLIRGESESNGGTGSTYTRITILWVNQDAFGESSAPAMTTLLQDITCSVPEAVIHVLGPRTTTALKDWAGSESLKGFLRNAADSARPYAPTSGDSGDHGEVDQADRPIIFSPWATGVVDIESIKPYVSPFVVNDDKLLYAIQDELKLRHATPEPAHRLVVITEVDTEYGRRMKDLAMSVFEGESGGEGGRPTDNVVALSYFRGLDGKTPNETGPGRPPPADSPKTQTGSSRYARANAAAAPQQPDGPQQFDYLDRLADGMRDRARREDFRVRAVGVLGSDVYDKLAVLSAFRQRFPDAVYFTTDLDARYTHPDDWDVARNLIVASSFGLISHNGTPSMRDSYQTAIFHATDAAIRGAGIDHNRRARVFEIGRDRAVDLSRDLLPEDLDRPWDAEPGQNDRRDRRTTALRVGIVASTVVALSVVAFAAWLSPTYRRCLFAQSSGPGLKPEEPRGAKSREARTKRPIRANRAIPNARSRWPGPTKKKTRKKAASGSSRKPGKDRKNG